MARIKGSPKTGGRVAGKSIDKQARSLVSAELAGSILETFEQLGGTAAMVAWASKNQTVFFTQVLARLYPTAPKDDEPGTVNFNTQINNMSDKEVACRIAFALAKGVHGDPSVAIDAPLVEREPVTPRWPEMTPQAACRPEPELLKPEPPEDPEREHWASELPLTPEERRNQALVRNTRESSISNYAGSAGEQGGGTARSLTHFDPRSTQRDRMLARRRELL